MATVTMLEGSLGTYAALSDADLVMQARAGDRNAFAVLYDRWFDALHDFLTRMTRNRDEAAELVQDSFLVAMQRLESLQQPDRFKSWLFQIAYRRALDRLEKRKRWQLTSPTPGDDGETNALLVQASADRLDDPDEAAAANEVAALVWEAAASLDERTFAVLDLHVRQGLSSAEIAEVLDVKPNHAYVLVNRMKERVGAAIGTFLLVRQGRRSCEGLRVTLADAALPPITEAIRKSVDRHVKDCDECQGRQRTLLAPIRAYGALAAVPARAGVKDEIWRQLDRAWPTGRPPSATDRWRHAAAIVGAIGLVALMPVLVVLGLAGDGSAAPVLFDNLTASPVDRTPVAAPSLGLGRGLALPPPPPYEPPPPAPTGLPTATASPSETSPPGQPPIVTIRQPTSGTRQATRQDATGPYAVVTLDGVADDFDSAPEALSYAWSSNAEGPLGSSPEVAGVKLHIFDFGSQCSGPLGLIGDASTAHRVTLRVTDDTGAIGEQTVEVTVEVPCRNELPSDEPSPSPSPEPSGSEEPTYGVSCTPGSHTVEAQVREQERRTSECTATAEEGFTGDVTWSCNVNGPPEFTCSVAPPTGNLGSGATSTTLTIAATGEQAGATATVVVSATVDGVVKTFTVSVLSE
ncbi:MAG: sigma-70 family RNA polymerase sigma factor [Nitriliruptorales bacterium]|nr:sigma-70 family RNA polymerase sigma factor [Nitriliruptorales bacterium]